ncbi:type II toxin-antitoxin system RelE/ParE family toxin [Antarctobacter sp.]|uniref:type II toxin-antitoxin system RelE/ParE family toxin n=1 Tax=Antarctobacter sp. TaxID=1872577 RepID=UPI003A91415A
MAIVDDISDDNPDAALALMEEIQGKVAQFPAHPKRCRPGRTAGTRELVVRPNYIVVYAAPRDGDGAACASCRADVALTNPGTFRHRHAAHQ